MQCKNRFTKQCKTLGLAMILVMMAGPVLAAVSSYVGNSAGNVRHSFRTGEAIYLYVDAADANRIYATGFVSSETGLDFISNIRKEKVSDNLWRWELKSMPEGNVTVALAVMARGLTLDRFNFPVVDAAANLLALHDSVSADYDPECIKCHGTKLNEKSLQRSVPSFHAAMVPEIPGYQGGTDKDCQYCHKSVDLLQQSAGTLRRNVKVEACTSCHGPAGPAKQYYQ
jgi:cytochrome c553